MNLKEYQLQATRTNADLGSKLLNNIHMVLGMGSEISEFFDAIDKQDKVNLGEELSDKVWYLANLCTNEELNLNDISYDFAFRVYPDFSNKDRLIYAISKMNNLLKRELAYGKVYDGGDMIDLIICAYDALESLYDEYNLDMEQCLQNNIDKLRIRFPDKFTNENALNRDLDSERKELEK